MRISEWVAAQWRRVATPRNLISISDPSLATIFQIGPPNFSGVDVTEPNALGVSAVYRAIALIAGTVGTLPLCTLRDSTDENEPAKRVRGGLFDDPGGVVGLVPMVWKETVTAHLVLHGNAYLRHIYGGAGQIVGLQPIHPLCVTIELPKSSDKTQPAGGKWFRATLIDGTVLRLDGRDLTHVMGMSMDGLVGMSVFTLARNGFGAAIAGDRSAAKMFSSGALISGMVTSEDDIESEDEDKINAVINREASGWENAGRVPFINRRLKFTPWTMTAQDAQFLESRQFGVREVARWFGVPPHLLMETSAASNWGTGIQEQNLGLARFNLIHWTTRIEQTCSRLLYGNQRVEFDFHALERPNPADEINLIIAQVQAGLLSLPEARVMLNRPAIAADPSAANTELVPA